MKRFTALALVAVAGCDRAPTPPPPPAEVARKAPAAPAAVPARGCADHLAVSLDGPGFAQNGAGRTFAKARLDAFLGAVAVAATGAINEACAAGELPPAKAAAVKSLVVASASGATEPVFVATGTPPALRLEFAFAEADLAVPSEMELRAGLACWTDPRSDQCSAMEP